MWFPHAFAELLKHRHQCGIYSIGVFSPLPTPTKQGGVPLCASGVWLLLVGIGSWWFHMTLRYEYQLLTSSRMIYATCIPFWASSRSSGLLGARVGAVRCGHFTAANILRQCICTLKTQLSTRQDMLCSMWGSSLKHPLDLKHIHDAAEGPQDEPHHDFWRVYLLAWLLFVELGYPPLRTGQIQAQRVGNALWFCFEGHGWWHLFTGIGVYFYLVYVEYLHCWLAGTNSFYLLDYKFGLPLISLQDPEGLVAHRKALSTKKLE